MFLSAPIHKNKLKLTRSKYEQGISLAVLLFILIIIGLLATALTNLTSQSTQSNAQQIIATRAFFAAESGANLQAQSIFPITGASSCANQTYNFTGNGLNGCTATTVCNTITVNSEDYFQVTSTGQCNSGQPLQATRTIEVRLKDIN
ncbi:MAG: PilX N-terminal domain-containing pilus assembly protein [Kangiellaceae bacterium]|nr:PilX N-terminal domain-containing pilus assembly protein [Kangiellaceae bacterium]